jgi:periplasmic protein TonB
MHIPTPPKAPIVGSGGYLDRRQHHPGLLVGTVALHLGIVGAILAYNPRIVGDMPEPIELITIAPPLAPPKPEPPRAQKRTTAEPRQQIDRQPIIVPLQPMGEAWPSLPPLPPTGAGRGEAILEKGLPEGAAPVLTPAGNDLRFARDLQPPYPSALERMEVEGSVTIRVQVGSDGRVTAVELVRADDPAFFAATRDWALKRWRFRPATQDGVAITTWLTRTVQFRIVR